MVSSQYTKIHLDHTTHTQSYTHNTHTCSHTQTRKHRCLTGQSQCTQLNVKLLLKIEMISWSIKRKMCDQCECFVLLGTHTIHDNMDYIGPDVVANYIWTSHLQRQAFCCTTVLSAIYYTTKLLTTLCNQIYDKGKKMSTSPT